MEDKHYQNKIALKIFRRNLRKNPTPAEKMLWQELRYRQFRYKFRRQFSVGNIIADFYCHLLKLIIEVDGSIHGEEKIRQFDELKQKELERVGFRVLRYTNDAVLYDLENVIRDIENQCETRAQKLGVKLEGRNEIGQTVVTRTR